ncbi:hypothetical protein AVEN_84824-1 [Araneus ventricosus]|uniref:Uncharacterized protein n=1 Tax=Araneus ventricosus TaxID=182803 RepID=A0A4Y2IZQ6_ARAVE|nr:hypothetical protein AVEN_84824-1 [Araneus ventricosus]
MRIRLWDYKRLWGYKLNEPVNHGEVQDYYEMFKGQLRYRCKCDGKDDRGKPLLNVFPFICATDPCLKDIVKPLPSTGWNGSACDCGPFLHEKDQDLTSP